MGMGVGVGVGVGLGVKVGVAEAVAVGDGEGEGRGVTVGEEFGFWAMPVGIGSEPYVKQPVVSKAKSRKITG